MNFKSVIGALVAIFSVTLIGQSTYAASDASPTSQQIVVTVKAGDTLSSIAKAYNTTYPKLFNANSWISNPDIIDVGDKVTIPTDGTELPDRFSEYVATYTAPAKTTSYKTSYSSSSTKSSQVSRASTSGNTYVWGNCTWYVKNRRPDLPNRLGNGGQWVAHAAALGYATGSTPRVGAVAEGPGHVAYVESVHGNGTVTISEMNYNGGLGVVHTRTVSASQFRYIY